MRREPGSLFLRMTDWIGYASTLHVRCVRDNLSDRSQAGIGRQAAPGFGLVWFLSDITKSEPLTWEWDFLTPIPTSD